MGTVAEWLMASAVVLILAFPSLATVWRLRKLRLRARPEFEQRPIEELPADAVAAIAAFVEESRFIGFEVGANLYVPQLTATASAMIVAAAEPAKSTTAALLMMMNNEVRLRTTWMFQTNLADGRTIQTTSRREIIPIPSPPGVETLGITRRLDRAYGLTLSQLAEIHAARVAAAGSEPTMLDSAKTLEECFREGRVRVAKWQAECGYYRREGEWLRHSRWGLFIIAIKVWFPVLAVRNVQYERAVDKAVKQWHQKFESGSMA